MPVSVLAGRLLVLLRERAGGRMRCHVDAGDLVWRLKDKYPDDQRPRFFEVEQALVELCEAKAIRMFGDVYGGGVGCVVTAEEKAEEVR